MEIELLFSFFFSPPPSYSSSCFPSPPSFSFHAIKQFDDETDGVDDGEKNSVHQCRRLLSKRAIQYDLRRPSKVGCKSSLLRMWTKVADKEHALKAYTVYYRVAVDIEVSAVWLYMALEERIYLYAGVVPFDQRAGAVHATNFGKRITRRVYCYYCYTTASTTAGHVDAESGEKVKG